MRDPPSRDSGNTVLSKDFPGGVLVMTGANSAAGLRSMAARYLFLDELDAYRGDGAHPNIRAPQSVSSVDAEDHRNELDRGGV